MDGLEEIERWLRATGMKESRLGLLATANPRAVDRVRNGTAQVATLDAILAYIRANKAPRK
jgi:hypothetical protein